MDERLTKAIKVLLRYYRDNPTSLLLGVIDRLLDMGTDRKVIPKECHENHVEICFVGKGDKKTASVTLPVNCDFTTFMRLDAESRSPYSMEAVVEDDEDKKAEDDKEDETTS